MSLSLNKPRLDNLAGDIWKSAERLRGKFKACEYQNIVLPNKYFYRYQPPTPADELLAEFWRLKKEAEAKLKGVAQ
jgi:hypothetical protein